MPNGAQQVPPNPQWGQGPGPRAPQGRQPPGGRAPQGSPPQGPPPQGRPTQGQPPQGPPPQGRPPQGPPQGRPPQGPPPQSYPPQFSAPQRPPQGAPPQWREPPAQGGGPSGWGGPPPPQWPGQYGGPPGDSGKPRRLTWLWITLAVVVVLAAGGFAAWYFWPEDDAEPDSTQTETSQPTADPSEPDTTEPTESPDPTEEPTDDPSPDADLAPITVNGSSALLEATQALSSLVPAVQVDAFGIGSGLDLFAAGEAQVVMALPGLPAEEIPPGAACVEGTEVHQFLYSAKILAFAVNIPGVDTLTLDAATVANIYQGTITQWNDPAISAQNPDITLPELPIVAIHRSDDTQDNMVVQRWLYAAAGSAWTGVDHEWMVAYGEVADGSTRVVEAVQATDGAIGYADHTITDDLTLVQLHNAGEALAPGPETAQGHLEQAIAEPGLTPDPTMAGAYPLVDFGYLAACLEYEDPAVGASVREFVVTALSPTGQTLLGEITGVEFTHVDELALAETIS